MVTVVGRFHLGTWVAPKHPGGKYRLLNGRVEDRAGRVLALVDEDGFELRDSPIPKVNRSK